MARPEIEPIGSREVYRSRWMSVREDEILRPDGTRGLYGVVDKPDFAVIAAVAGGHVHLVEQYRYPVTGRYWEMPQGSWDKEAADPLGLAKAELREETGIVAESMQHVGHLFLAHGFSSQGYDIFLATGLSHRRPQLEPEEQGLVNRPFEISAVEAMIRDGAIKDATTVAAFGLLRLRSLV